MGTNLVAIKDEMHSTARVQAFRDVLAPYKLPIEAWRAGLVATYEQDPGVLNYMDLTSTMNGAMTIAVLGLRIDKATGQSCLVPFAGKAQPIIMVQGYTVIAARGGYTLQGTLIGEGDKYAERAGSDPGIDHTPAADKKGKVIGAYAVARSKQMPTLFSPIMTIDQLLAARDSSKGYQQAKAKGRSHPWITNLEAMMIKTPKRLLAKDIPNDQLRQSNWLETMHDMGKVSWLNQEGHGQVIEPEPEPLYPERQPNVTDAEDLTAAARPKPALVWKVPDGRELSAKTAAEWAALVTKGIAGQDDVEKLKAALDRNRAAINAIMVDEPEHARTVFKAFNDKGVF